MTWALARWVQKPIARLAKDSGSRSLTCSGDGAGLAQRVSGANPLVHEIVRQPGVVAGVVGDPRAGGWVAITVR